MEQRGISPRHLEEPEPIGERGRERIPEPPTAQGDYPRSGEHTGQVTVEQQDTSHGDAAEPGSTLKRIRKKRSASDKSKQSHERRLLEWKEKEREKQAAQAADTGTIRDTTTIGR